MRMTIAMLLVALTGTPATLAAQESEAEKLKPLQERIDQLERQHADEIDDLRFELEGLQADSEELRRRIAEAPTSPNVFNPSVTVFGNFLGRLDDRDVFLDDDPAEGRIDDRFNLREVEIDFRAAIDPWADGVLIVVYESEAPNEFEAAIEEGYVVLKKLPFLDRAPAGLKLKAGRFRTQFGRLNRIHTHDLPWMTRPRSYTNFLGPEGYLQNGLSGEFFLPSPSESDVLGATFEVLDGGEIPIAEDVAGSKLATGGRVHWFHELSANRNFEVGLSGWANDSDTRLWGLDWNFAWKPHVAGEWRSFLVGGELFLADLDQAGLDDSPSGGFVWSQYQLGRNLYAGVRYDRAEEIGNESLVTETYGAYLTYYTSEFLRFRLGVEHSESDVALLDDVDTALVELNFIFGSHPVEPYWVNR